MRSRYRAVVFDLDDTLYPEQDYVLSGFRAVARWAERHLAVPADTGFAELQTLFVGGCRQNTFDRWLDARGLSVDGVASTLVQVYRAHEPVLAPFPEVPGLLAKLRGRYRLGLLSDGRLAGQQRKLAALELAPHFDSIVFSDQWGRAAWKPSALPFEILLGRLGLGGEQAVYVADNPGKDFLGARRVGMVTVRATWAQGLYAQVEPPSPDHASDLHVHTANDLPALLNGLGGHARTSCPPVTRSV